jgi:hypothetical protein
MSDRDDVWDAGTDRCRACGNVVVVIDLGDEGVEVLCECFLAEALV